ncbi:juvenile hormone esterase-like [Cotesia glomerata]|uniref:Carboxylic ester hydrolase n=1 Tax=Cotesia glomerata TaxID=32391 RepID=A0AAV7J3U4_COTGL|nr:juvenile hormone esterase-like [Cotesia glomerata]KAH0566744.1 hypothetical protein KQX54_003737 [Cotesia glomerata]
MRRFLLEIFIATILVGIVNSRIVTIVRTNKGRVLGRALLTVQSGKEYVAFKGIPYAKPPTGRRRFKPPEETDSWEPTLLRALKDPNPCPQFDIDTLKTIGYEHCLFLNVYTPRVRSYDIRLRAVMVWIHYGAFISGSIDSSFYGPDFLIEKDVVVVAMNYRLGALGFLSLNHANCTGNAGLKDQLLALKWVQKNIKSFGGDPRKVTIFGESSGAVSVQLHKLSGASKGLFRASIAMSGSPLNSWGFSSSREAESSAFSLGRKLGINTVDKDVLLEELYRKTSEDIVSATNWLIPDLMIFNGSLPLPFKPTVEIPVSSNGSYFIIECPIKKYRERKFHQGPQIMGFTSDEALSFARPVGILFQIIGKQLTDNLLQPASDLSFTAGIDLTQRYLTAFGKAPIYYYRNSFDYDQSLHKIEGNNNLPGTGHADDVAHIFYIRSKRQPVGYWSDIGMHREKLVTMWTNFAKYLNPTPKGKADPLLKIKWWPSGKKGLNLEIGKVWKLQKRPVNKRILDKERELNRC